MIKEEWARGTGSESISMQLQCFINRLTKWNRVTFGSVGRKIKNLKRRLERLQNEPQVESIINAKHKVSQELNEMLKREEII